MPVPAATPACAQDRIEARVSLARPGARTVGPGGGRSVEASAVCGGALRRLAAVRRRLRGGGGRRSPCQLFGGEGGSGRSARTRRRDLARDSTICAMRLIMVPFHLLGEIRRTVCVRRRSARSVAI
jgi:hypothetical protein